MTFGLGMAVGIPTILLSVYQGLPLGAFIALHYNRDLTVDFLGWLAIHGVTELGALVLFAAGGLVIAEKMLFPGRYSRIENLAMHGRLAAQMAAGAVLMLFVAAILEGGFRQLVASTPLRFAIGFGVGALWLAYFCLAGRKAKSSATMTLDPRAHVGIFRRRAAPAAADRHAGGGSGHGRARRPRRAAGRLRASTCSSGCWRRSRSSSRSCGRSG